MYREAWFPRVQPHRVCAGVFPQDREFASESAQCQENRTMIEDQTFRLQWQTLGGRKQRIAGIPSVYFTR